MAHKLGVYVCCGLTGSGKTTWLADRAKFLLRDNAKCHKKYPQLQKRVLASNIKLSDEIEKKYKVGEIGDRSAGIWYWEDPEQVERLRNVDLLWDELATNLDSTQYQFTPLSLKRWLQQHRKYGVCIYGTVQDFPMLDIAMRRLVHRVRYARKMLGTRDINAGMPDPKYPWGLVLLRTLRRESYDSTVSEYQFEPFSFELIFYTPRSVKMFDTTQEVKAGQMPPLKHMERRCNTCNATKTMHV